MVPLLNPVVDKVALIHLSPRSTWIFPLSMLFNNHQFIYLRLYMFLEVVVSLSNIHTNINPTWTALGTNPSLRIKKSVAKSLSYGRLGGLLHKHSVTKKLQIQLAPLFHIATIKSNIRFMKVRKKNGSSFL